MKVYYDDDASLDVLKGKKLAILGFGSQGHAHALNLKESGMDVCVAELKDSAPWKAAKEAGLDVKEAADAVKSSDVIMVLLPDQLQKKVYEQAIAPNLDEGNTLAFAHGFNIHYKQIKPPKNINVITSIPPWIRGKSRCLTASSVIRPIPGIAKTDSVSTAPPRASPNSIPIMVKMGIKAFLKACLTKTTEPESPLERAVRI